MKNILWLFLFLTLSSSCHLHAAEMVRFDFQQDVGEGTYDFFRIDVDLKNKSGVLCYFDDSSFVAAGGKLDKIREVIWSQSVDLAKVKHACGKFSLYNSMGWFMTDSFKYQEADYRYVFIGHIRKDGIDGKLYEFRDHRPSNDSRSYKTTNQTTLPSDPVNFVKLSVVAQ